MAGLGDLAGLLKQAQKMQREIARIQEELKTRTVEGSASGGAVRVVATGGLELAKIQIDPSVMSSGDASLIETWSRSRRIRPSRRPASCRRANSAS